MGKFTWLVGVVELLIFWIFGTGGGVLLPLAPQPDKIVPAVIISAAPTATIRICRSIFPFPSTSAWVKNTCLFLNIVEDRAVARSSIFAIFFGLITCTWVQA